MNVYFAGLVENYYNLKLESDEIFKTIPFKNAINKQREGAFSCLIDPKKDTTGGSGHLLEAVLFDACRNILNSEHPRLQLLPAPAEWDFDDSGKGFDYVAGIDFSEGQIVGKVSVSISRGNPTPRKERGKTIPHIGLSPKIHHITHEILTSFCLSANPEVDWNSHINDNRRDLLDAFAPIVNFANFHHMHV